MPAKWWKVLAALVLTLVAGVAAPCLAIDASNVLVLYNSASPDGAAIADYYTAIHPGVATLAINNVPLTEQITYDVYLNTIRPQVLAGLNSNIDVIVTTKGLPLRIDNPNPDPVTYRVWNRYSSLESELTRVDTINSRTLMGNQRYNRPANQGGNPLGYNPYRYAAAGEASFDYDAYGIRLTSRLDGFTVSDVEGSLDRAQGAVYDAPSYTFLVDNDPATTYTKMASLVSNVLNPRGILKIYDNTSTFVTDAPGAVIGYVSNGTHGGAAADYLLNPTSGLCFRPANGAVFSTWESFNAYTFQGDVTNPKGQGLVAQWLAYGGTAGVGTVEEPTTASDCVTNEDQMFRMLLDGYTFVEAAWNATAELSFVNTVVGDPLMHWKPVFGGDINADGVVDYLDACIIGNHWEETGVTWSEGDLNGDGIVNYLDVVLLGSSWGNIDDTVPSMASGLDLDIVPEPGTLCLLTMGIVCALSRRCRLGRS